MRFVLSSFSIAVQVFFLPLTLALGLGLLVGAYVIGRQIRPARSCEARGELVANEWLGLARAEWMGA